MTSFYKAIVATRYAFLIMVLLLAGGVIAVQGAPLQVMGPAEEGEVSPVAQALATHLQPSSAIATVSETLTIVVSVSDLTEALSGFQFDLTYDPSIVELLSVEPASFPTSTGRQILCPTPVEQPGQVRLACVFAGSADGPTGRGNLVTLSFRALSLGQSSLDLDAIQLASGTRPSASIAVEPESGLIIVANSVDRLYLPLILRASEGAVSRSRPDSRFSLGLSLGSLGLSALACLVVTPGLRKRVPWRRIVSALALVSLLAGTLPLSPVAALTTDDSPAAVSVEPSGVHQSQPSVAGVSSGYSTVSQQADGCFWADLDCNQRVDLQDLGVSAERWNCVSGDACYDAGYDYDSDGDVDVLDLATLGNEYDVAPPEITLVAPADQAVLGGSSVQVNGTVSDAHAVEVAVNGVAATVNGNTFAATVPLENGNQMLSVVATDQLGMGDVVAHVVFADLEGPMLDIRAPQPDQAVYSLQPTLAISYTDFYTDVNPSSLDVRIVDAGGGSTDVTGDLTATSAGAWGMLSAPLAEDASYTLTVSVADSLGNVSQQRAVFYVPTDPGSIVPPEVPEDAGWVSGYIYDSTNCDEYLQGCDGLPGAKVTLSRAGSLTDTITGVVITGPDGFFAFPLPETGRYWLRAEKENYTYGQREVDVVREHGTAVNEIYLTPFDPAVTVVSYPLSATVVHTNSDGTMEVEIAPEALAPGQVVTVSATNFEHVEFLPSGELPEGTGETFAFDLGRNNEVAFTQPITVRMQNSRGFGPATEIPLGYWNQETMDWEHVGIGIVDASGTWVVMTVTHFSPFDCNDPVVFEGDGDADADDETEDDGPCAGGEGACFVNAKSGVFREEYTLPPVSVLGESVAPRLLYNSRRANPVAVLDFGLSLNLDSATIAGETIGFDLFVEGKKVDSLVFSNTVTDGEVGRFRYLWDGRDALGNLLPPGSYGYAVKFNVDWMGQYYYTTNGRFGGPPDWSRPTGVFERFTKTIWKRGTVELDTQTEGALGSGWALDGVQRLYTDDMGHIMISNGNQNDEFYHLSLNGDGLVAYYPFDGNANDASGNGHDGILRNSVVSTTDRFGRSESAYYFNGGGYDGSSAYIEVPHDPGLELEGDLTLSVWIAPESLTRISPILMKDKHPGQNYGLWLSQGLSGISYQAYYDNSDPYHETFYSLRDLVNSEWVHIAFVKEIKNGNTNLKMYYDGELVTEEELNYQYPVLKSEQPLFLGWDMWHTYPQYLGAMDDVSIYGRALHESEIKALYNMPASGGIDSWEGVVLTLNETDHSWLEYDENTDTYTRYYPNGTQIHFNTDGTHDYTLDRQGNKTVYAYTAGGEMDAMSVIPAGETTPRWVWDFTYQNGNLAAVTDPAGRTTTFSVDAHNHLTGITGANGASRQYAYDARGLLTHYTDETGQVTEHVYDDYGRVVRVIEPARAVFDPATGEVEMQQDVRTFTPSDVGYPLLNDVQAGTLLSTPLTSVNLVDRIDYGRGGISGHTDKWGRWLDKTDALSRTTTYQRDAAGHLLRQDNPDGTCSEYTYGANGNLLERSRIGAAQCALDPGDRDPVQVQTASYTYEERFNQLKTWTDSLGNTATYVYDYEQGLGEAGNLIGIEYSPVSDENGVIVTPTVTYSYNTWGRVVTKTDELGLVTAYRYTQGTPDEAYGQSDAVFAEGVTPVPGLLTQVIDDYEGSKSTFTYTDFDAAGEPQTVAEPSGAQVRYTHDSLGRVLTEEDALGVVTKYEYDASGQLVYLVEDYTPDGTTGRNVVTEYTYDPNGNVLGERINDDGVMNQTLLTYDVNHKLSSTEDANGNRTTYMYNDADQLVRLTDPLGNAMVYTYTVDGKADQVQYPGGRVTQFFYDDSGRIIRQIEDYGSAPHLNLTTVYTYGPDNQLTAMADPAGAVTCFTYDAIGRRIAETQDCGGLNLTTTLTYTIDGKPARVVDPQGVTQVNVYDRHDRLILTRQDDGALDIETRYGYDEIGNLTVVTDTRGTVARYEYDVLNRPAALHADAGGLDLATRYGYDRLDYQSIVTDANGIVSLVEYNAFGQPVRSIEDYGGLNVTTRYAYDNASNLVAITDDHGNTTRYTYDALNRQTQTRYADGTSVAVAYNPDGTTASRTDQAGERIDFYYDEAGRLTSRTFPGGGTQHISYDEVGRMSGAWQTMLGHTTGVSFTYDNLGTVVGHTQTTDGFSWTTDYDYDYAAGTVATTYPSGVQVFETTDALGRLDQVQQDGTPVASYAYDDAAGTQTLTYANGVVRHIETDALGHVTRLSTGDFADYRYSYDAIGNRTAMQRMHEPGEPADVYAYDSLNQLTQVWYEADATDPTAITVYDHLQMYDIDVMGNRLVVRDDETSVVYQPSDGRQLTNPMHRYEQVGGQTLTYDLKGNLTSDGVNTYMYDGLNRQTGMTGAGNTAEYVYDMLGRRVAKTVNGETTFFVYGAASQVLEERDAGNQLVARYVYGSYVDEVLTMERDGNTYTYHHDALGSVTEVTNDGGDVLERYKYDVYGAPEIFDAGGTLLAASAIENPYLFTGRRYDAESGHYYYRARMYSPSLGRFLQMDPLGYVDGLNLYAYVGNNPIIYRDPTGNSPEDYHLNGDGSVTFTGRGATVWEAVNLFPSLGYSNWQEAVAQFNAQQGVEGWWTEDGSWTGKKGAHLEGRTLHPKGKGSNEEDSDSSVDVPGGHPDPVCDAHTPCVPDPAPEEHGHHGDAEHGEHNPFEQIFHGFHEFALDLHGLEVVREMLEEILEAEIFSKGMATFMEYAAATLHILAAVGQAGTSVWKWHEGELSGLEAADDAADSTLSGVSLLVGPEGPLLYEIGKALLWFDILMSDPNLRYRMLYGEDNLTC